MSTTDKPYLSPSQIESHSRCPEAYRRRYIEREIIPPGVAAAKGTGLHGGAKVNFRQKIESHQDLTAQDIIEASVAAFEEVAHGSLSLTDDELSVGAEKTIGRAKDDVARLAEIHAKEQAPDYQPVLVEEKIRIALPGAAHDLLGVIDLADDQERLTDFKTTGKRKSQAEADGSVQLTIYATAYKARTKRDPKEVRLDTIVQTKTKTTRDILRSQRSVADLRALAHRVNAVSAAVQSGVFPPTTPSAWWCAPKWCGYWSTCPFVNSERTSLDEGSE